MTKSAVFRLIFVVLLCLGLAAAGGYIWLRNSPYWAGITLFAEDYRVENFRNMDAVFPYEPVARKGDVWDLPRNERRLTETYPFNGERQSLPAFLERSQTTGLLVLHNAQIVHEAYYLGADENARFASWSVAKSVLSALVGIAVGDGLIEDIEAPIETFAPELEGTAYGAVPLIDVLTMSSGIGFDEDYDSLMSDVNQLFIGFATGTTLVETLADQEAIRTPGIYNEYISSDSIALGLALEGATGTTIDAFLEERLWGPMGAEADAYWNTGRNGEVLPLCCLNATLRDYGRFGQLYLQGGARDGVQIIPAEWINDTITPEGPHLQPGENPHSFWTFGYGYHWWIPENPQGDYLAIGIWGQYIYIHPRHQIVIVKTSADPDFDLHDHETVEVFRAIAESLSSG